MSDSTKEDRIRARAYQLWESDGRPDGRSDEFWAHARAEIADDGDADPDAPQTAGEELGTLTPGLITRIAGSSS